MSSWRYIRSIYQSISSTIYFYKKSLNFCLFYCRPLFYIKLLSTLQNKYWIHFYETKVQSRLANIHFQTKLIIKELIKTPLLSPFVWIFGLSQLSRDISMRLWNNRLPRKYEKNIYIYINNPVLNSLVYWLCGACGAYFKQRCSSFKNTFSYFLTEITNN